MLIYVLNLRLTSRKSELTAEISPWPHIALDGLVELLFFLGEEVAADGDGPGRQAEVVSALDLGPQQHRPGQQLQRQLAPVRQSSPAHQSHR